MSDDPGLFDIIGTTRSMRRLKPDPVPDELIHKILQAGLSAANGGNTQKWRFLVVKDPAIKKAVQVWYKKAFDEVVGPRYASSAPPPGATPDRYKRQHTAVEYLTEHFHEAPVWIVACIDEGPNPPPACVTTKRPNLPPCCAACGPRVSPSCSSNTTWSSSWAWWTGWW